MKYLAWAVSGVPEFQLKFSIRPCQALILKYLFLWRRPPKGAAVCWFHLALCSGVGTVEHEECHCLPHTTGAQGLFRPVHVSDLGRASVGREGPPSGGKGLHREGRASIGREGSLLLHAIGCRQGEGGEIEWVGNPASDEFEQALGVGDGQGSLVCWRPWGCKESDAT